MEMEGYVLLYRLGVDRPALSFVSDAAQRDEPAPMQHSQRDEDSGEEHVCPPGPS